VGCRGPSRRFRPLGRVCAVAMLSRCCRARLADVCCTCNMRLRGVAPGLRGCGGAATGPRYGRVCLRGNGRARLDVWRPRNSAPRLACSHIGATMRASSMPHTRLGRWRYAGAKGEALKSVASRPQPYPVIRICADNDTCVRAACCERPCGACPPPSSPPSIPATEAVVGAVATWRWGGLVRWYWWRRDCGHKLPIDSGCSSALGCLYASAPCYWRSQLPHWSAHDVTTP
jgi:hypothetical protein